MLKLILDQDDPERSFVPYSKTDALVLYVNNMGGMSVLEMYAIVDQALTQLRQWLLHPGDVPLTIRANRAMGVRDARARDMRHVHDLPQRARLLPLAPQPNAHRGRLPGHNARDGRAALGAH